MLQANTFHHALGVSRAGAGTRLWLEGKRLLNHGFTLGTPCQRIWAQGKLRLEACSQSHWDQLERQDRTTIAGTVNRPIVDITGARVAACFPTGNVMVSWARGVITIEGV